jgi:hypothetical protein
MKTIQLNILTAIEERDKGMNQAMNHADAVENNWSQSAYQFLLRFLSDKPKGFRFMIEDLRMKAQLLKALPDPPSARAFGGVAVRARNNGIIRSYTLKPVNNSKAHRAFATEWEKI